MTLISEIAFSIQEVSASPSSVRRFNISGLSQRSSIQEKQFFCGGGIDPVECIFNIKTELEFTFLSL